MSIKWVNFPFSDRKKKKVQLMEANVQPEESSNLQKVRRERK